MPARVYAKNQTRFDLTQPEGVAQLRSTFLAAMRRNLATSGYVIAWVPSEHGYNRGATKYSEPGCLIASPSYDAKQEAVHGAPFNQDYVYNWTRDAALAAIELSFDEPPPGATESQRMIDYVAFAKRAGRSGPRSPYGPLSWRYLRWAHRRKEQEHRPPLGACTANYAAFYYCVASALKRGLLKFPLQADGIAAATVVKAEEFFSKLGINPAAGHEANAADVLRDAGDKMLDSVVYHSNHLELSEQFDKSTGFEKSVENLTWSYSAFLNALRARSD